MRLLVFSLCIALLTVYGFGQDSYAPVNQCDGALNIFENNSYNLQFTGEKNGIVESAYPSLKAKVSNNQLWVSYIAASDGELSLNASVKEGFVKMVIFKQEMNDICDEVSRGIAEIQRLYVKEELTEIGLSKEKKSGYVYPLSLKKGEKIQILFLSFVQFTKLCVKIFG